MTIPGIGLVGATALAASVTDPHQFRSGRQFARWLGLTPLQKSSGGKELEGLGALFDVLNIGNPVALPACKARCLGLALKARRRAAHER